MEVQSLLYQLVLMPLRRHRDDLSPDQFNTLFLKENSCPGNLLQFGNGECSPRHPFGGRAGSKQWTVHVAKIARRSTTIQHSAFADARQLGSPCERAVQLPQPDSETYPSCAAAPWR